MSTTSTSTRDLVAQVHRGILTPGLAALLLLTAGLTPGQAPPPPTAATATSAQEKVDPAILEQIEKSRSRRSVETPGITIMVDLTQTSDLTSARFDTDTAVRALQVDAAASQSDLVDAITEHGGTVHQQFWISNAVLATVPASAIEELALSPAVERIAPNLEVTAPDLQVSDPMPQADHSAWGIERIGADAVTSELGLTGQGVKVAVLDTGIDAAHPDLGPRLFTVDPGDPSYPGGWIQFDAAGVPVSESVPHDTQAHGTHVAGTIAGGDSSGSPIGVAPGASLMASPVLPGGSGTMAQVLAGMQWAMAPTDRFGNPAGEPADVVNMSLGSETYAQDFVEPTRNMYLSGVFPAFSIGNWCSPGSSSSPGNVYEAVSVGATDITEDVGVFSCGEEVRRTDFPEPPADWPESWVVPDVSAPGVDILSARPGGGYGLNSGTSMATPHVAGTVALMMEADTQLGVDEALDVLCTTAHFDSRHGTERPNVRYGCGRIDAWGAATQVAVSSGITGTVTRARAGDPMAEVLVSADGQVRHTAANGSFDLRLRPGTHEVTFSRYGSASQSKLVTVGEDEMVRVDVALADAKKGAIRGTVVYGPSGEPVPGASVVLLAGDRPSTVTDEQGRYALSDIPAGAWTIQARSPGLLDSEPVDGVVTGEGPGTADLAIPGRPAIERVSLAPDGGETTGTAGQPSVSADGRFTAYQSNAPELDPDITNGQYNIYVEDRASGVVERVTQTPDGSQPDLGSTRPEISADGRWVAFQSAATNLVPGDTNGRHDIFLFDRATGTTALVSTATDGGPSDGDSTFPAISPDGGWVAFQSLGTNLVDHDSNGMQDVYLYEVATATVQLVSRSAQGTPGNRASHAPSVSANGEFVVYHSFADNLLAGNDTNGVADVMVLNRATGVVQRASVNSGWGQANSHSLRATVSNDGRFVAYESLASNLVGGDANGATDVFVRDRATFTTHCVTCLAGGANGSSTLANISGDGTAVAYQSQASNLVPGDDNSAEDIFVTRWASGVTTLVSTGDNRPATLGSSLAAVDQDGSVVIFQSFDASLAGPDTNGLWDVYLRDLEPSADRAQFVVSNLRLVHAPGRGAIKASVSVTNVGSKAGDYTVGAYLDGELTATTPVSLDSGSSRDVTMWLPAEPGSHSLRIGPLTQDFHG